MTSQVGRAIISPAGSDETAEGGITTSVRQQRVLNITVATDFAVMLRCCRTFLRLLFIS